MTLCGLANNFFTTVGAGGHAVGSTTLALAAGSVADLNAALGAAGRPAVSPSAPVRLTVVKAAAYLAGSEGASSLTIFLVSEADAATDVVTVAADEGTTDLGFVAGDVVEMRPTAALFNDLSAAASAADAASLQGNAVAATEPLDGQVLAYSVAEGEWGPVSAGVSALAPITYDPPTRSIGLDTRTLLLASNSLSDVASAAAARANLGLGTAATLAATAVEQAANKGQPNGYAGLDPGGKLPTAQLPAAVLGSVDYQGTWNASMNTPALASGVGAKGAYYKVGIAGTTAVDGNAAWNVGDWIVFDGTSWDQVSAHETVASVNGQTGAVTGLLSAADNLADVASASAARTNLGLGTAATHAASDFLTPTGVGSGLTGLSASQVGGVPAGLLKGSAGAFAAAAAGTDYLAPGGDGSGLSNLNPARLSAGTAAVSITGNAATATTAAALSGSIAESQVTGLTADLAARLSAADNLADVASASAARANLGLGTAATYAAGAFLTPNGSGSALTGLSAAQIGSTPPGLLKGSSGAIASATNGVDYLAPAGNGSGLTGITPSQVGALSASNNLSDLASAATARANLGLGSSSAQPASAFLQPGNNLADLASPAAARGNLGLGSASTLSAAAVVQSVALAAPGSLFASPVGFAVSGGAAAGSLVYNTQPANAFLAGPTSGPAAAPAMRSIAYADLPQSPIATVSASATLTAANNAVNVNAASGPVAVQLPDATALPPGCEFRVKKVDATGNAVTLAAVAGQTIDGAATAAVAAPWAALGVKSDGSNWFIY